ncbi:MAG: amidoligase family protein [Alteromonadaceae bacterium]|nr:amidoligase family protein [Alteromonadaceae bacterium]
MNASDRCRMPTTTNTSEGDERKVGVEIELSGLSYSALVAHVARLLGGEARLASRYVTEVETTDGTYSIELDADPIKQLDLDDDRLPQSLRDLGSHAMTVIDSAAEKIVPLEIVAPPLPLSRLPAIESLVDELHTEGARGSREAIYFAFGLQLNPELPDLQAGTILSYLQAFAALYEWLKTRHQLDISRKFTPYIEPWSNRYTQLLLADDYQPGIEKLMQDYLHHNPTRNRALDLLPLFAYLDKPLLERHVKDPRVKSRPTLHYRLPDCDIGNQDWHFSSVWNDWVIVDDIANHPEDLEELRQLYHQARTFSFHNLTHSWWETTARWLERKGYV